MERNRIEPTREDEVLLSEMEAVLPGALVSPADDQGVTESPERSRKKVFSDQDRRLLIALRRDPRATNRALAQELGVAQATVAARIRRLSEAGVMRVVATTDSGACGYDLMLLLGIRVARKARAEVGEQLARIPEVIGVRSVLGRFDLCATLVAQDKKHLLQVLQGPIGALRGVENLEWEFVLEVTKHRAEFSSLTNTPHLTDLPIRSDDLDDLDKNIISELRVDGRRSNREVARRLSVSEGTIRGRLRRLENNRVVRSMAVADPEMFGLKCVAYVFLKVEHGSSRLAADALSKMPEMRFVAITLGRYEVVAVALVPERNTLAELVSDQITALPGVERVETMEAVTQVKHDFRWVRLT